MATFSRHHFIPVDGARIELVLNEFRFFVIKHLRWCRFVDLQVGKLTTCCDVTLWRLCLIVTFQTHISGLIYHLQCYRFTYSIVISDVTRFPNMFLWTKSCKKKYFESAIKPMLKRTMTIDHKTIEIKPNHKKRIFCYESINWLNRHEWTGNEEPSKQQKKKENNRHKQTHNLQYLFVNVDIDGNQLAAMEYYVLFVLFRFYANCMQIDVVSNEMNE